MGNHFQAVIAYASHEIGWPGVALAIVFLFLLGCAGWAILTNKHDGARHPYDEDDDFMRP